MLRELLNNVGLNRFSEVLTNAALPSIRLKAQLIDKNYLKSGITKFGGQPDFPRGYSWPDFNGSPLPFLAQINLLNIAPYDIKQYLPTTGMLYFFFDLDAFFDTVPRDNLTWRVLYYDSVLTDFDHFIFPDIQHHYPTCMINCSTEMTLPDYNNIEKFDTTLVRQFRLPEALTEMEEQTYYKAQQQLSGTANAKHHIPVHRLLGYPDNIQWTMYSELGDVSTDWQLLLQMDSDDAPDTNWGDTGRIYFWINRQDLANCDFSKVQLLLQST